MVPRRRHRRSAARHHDHQPRRGAFGPRAIRALAYEAGTYHIDLDLEIFDHLDVVDFGDAHCPHGDAAAGHANIRSRVAEVASRRIVPIILGGDHSITWPAATAVADTYGYGNVGIVHFDAHADTADIIDGNLASHGTPMRRLIESGAVPGDRFVQVGLRGYWPPAETFSWMREQGMVWHTMQEIWERGFQAVLDDAVAEALERADHLYISVDVDSLDPAHAPGTGTPEPGGLTSADLLRAVRELARRHDVVGMDVVEVAPALRRERPHRERRPPPRVRGARRDGGTQARQRRLIRRVTRHLVFRRCPHVRSSSTPTPPATTPSPSPSR